MLHTSSRGLETCEYLPPQGTTCRPGIALRGTGGGLAVGVSLLHVAAFGAITGDPEGAFLPATAAVGEDTNSTQTVAWLPESAAEGDRLQVAA
jgi:hypothetical protein